MGRCCVPRRTTARLRPTGPTAWYRFALRSPAVPVVLCAPHSPAALEENLSVLSVPGPMSAGEYEALAAHGERVQAHADQFP